jgi:tRNA pseudouridine38-40 synthase
MEPPAPDLSDEPATGGVGRVRLVVSYHGAGFSGWQIQSSARTVEGELTKAVARLNGGPTKVWGASRTDAGVHALGQVACFEAARARDDDTWVRALNDVLPDAVVVRHAEQVDGAFHPRHSARGKTYVYDLWCGAARDPFLADRSWHVQLPRGCRIDVAGMQAAAALLVGEHDFASFQAAGCDARGTVRVLWAVDVRELRPDHVRVVVSGSAFLKYMVRNIVGTLVEVGRGRRTTAWVGEVLAACDRRAAGPTAAPHGLTLIEVRYPDFPWLRFGGDRPSVETWR